MFQYASLGDYVWEDLDADGIQDAGEPPIAGVTVTLFNGVGTQIGAPTTTDANGLYLFENLVPGDYYLVFTVPGGYVFSPQDQGADDALDSDADVISGQTATTSLVSDEIDVTWDAGIYQYASLGDYAWEDLDADGIQDAGEPPVPGVTVTLYDSANNVVATDTTDASGLYLFDNLVPGDYYVIFTLPAGYNFSPQNQGGDDTLDSDADTTTGRTTTTTLISNEDDLMWDAGIYQYASLGDYAWEDLDADGIQDAGEPPIPNVTVTLYNGAGTQLTADITDASGLYLFDNLVPGDYYVVFTLPAGYNFSPQDQGADDALDSDADTTTGRTTTTTLISNEDDLTWDAGMFQYASLGDFVWDDLDADGVQGAGEPGIPNVTVMLYNSSDNLVASTTTDASGLYLFENLVPGDYYVVFTLPVDYVFSPQDQRADDALDSDADTTTGRTATTTLISNEDDLTWDAGMYQYASLGDFMWYDNNENGIQDIAEPPVEGVEVTLYDGGGVQVGLPTTTDVNGFYNFTNLIPGDYYVRFALPADYLFTAQDRGLDDTLDSDADDNGQTEVTTLISGEDDPTWDAGIVPEPDAALPFAVTRTPTPVPPTGGQSAPACGRVCVNWMLYHTNQTGDWEIFRLGDMEGSLNANLSQGEDANDIAPSRSPNAEWIVFASDRDDNWEIYLAPANGDSSLIRRLTFNTIAIDTDPVWGPGNTIVFESTRTGNWDLFLMDMTSGAVRQITDSEANDINAYWSPDGRKLVFQSDRSGQWQIYELDLATLDTRLLSDGQGVDLDPQYSNGGTRIAFRSYREGSDSVLYLMNADGSGVELISDLAGDATDHSWSPDDSLIAYQSDLDGDLDIYVYDVGSGQTRKLTDNDIPDYAPTWQCSTTRVVFTSDIAGNPDIYDAEALPISAPAIEVDEEAVQFTFAEADDIYPEGAPLEENASREGQLPNIAPLGEQTIFLEPDVSLTEIDLSLEDSDVTWAPIEGCAALPPEEE
jgi:Tol biopolymer transport system component/protocatechuate 3,4-dioxygenase beta subunit